MPARDEEKAKRLAAALRENLKRRKARTRALDEGETSGDADGADPSADGGSSRDRR
jgi:hypothetical protein